MWTEDPFLQSNSQLPEQRVVTISPAFTSASAPTAPAKSKYDTCWKSNETGGISKLSPATWDTWASAQRRRESPSVRAEKPTFPNGQIFDIIHKRFIFAAPNFVRRQILVASRSRPAALHERAIVRCECAWVCVDRADSGQAMISSLGVASAKGRRASSPRVPAFDPRWEILSFGLCLQCPYQHS